MLTTSAVLPCPAQESIFVKSVPSRRTSTTSYLHCTRVVTVGEMWLVLSSRPRKLNLRKSGNWKSLAEKAGVSQEDLTHFLSYAAQFLGNTGNFKSFGDSKFIPRLTKEKFAALAKSTPAAEKLYGSFQDDLYQSSSAARMHLGYPDEGHVSTYYPNSPGLTRLEIEHTSDFLKEKQLLPENTRMRKTPSGDFEVLIASAVTDPATKDLAESEWTLSGPLQGKKLRLVWGDHSVEMAKIARNLAEAKEYALNDQEDKMQAAYVKSFHDGSMLAHKDSQRHWIKDRGPMVESNIGFIETYRDPQGIRGEWEGFAAMVNKERTRAFTTLVESAPKQIPKLPWPREFEKDKFLSPDFTSLEVLTINIPNYDDIRQVEGFKNVSLGNVLSAKPPSEPTPFLRDADQDLNDRYRDAAFEVQVGIHELLGHGCGKLLQETSPGTYNFDINNPPHNPITNAPVSTWYKPGETWGSVFGGMGPSYEECRAESVAMSLCPDFGILQIFGFGDGTETTSGPAADVLYICYLSMARAGITALQFWDPAARKWGQAHMQARFAILKVFLSAGDDFCRLTHSSDQGTLTKLEIHLDRSKIASHGRPAINAFLQKLQVYKATADVTAGRALYDEYTNVDPWWAEQVRPEVLRQAKPRKVFVQANTFLHHSSGDSGAGAVQIELREYDATPEGMIQSFVDRDYI
nr:dipeptidyl peptidase 3 [Quercus suber]